MNCSTCRHWFSRCDSPNDSARAWADRHGFTGPLAPQQAPPGPRCPGFEWRPGFGTERGFHPWRLMDWAERVGFRVPDRLAFGRRSMPGSNPFNFQSGWEPLLWLRPGGDLWMDKQSIAAPATGAKFSKVTWRKASNEYLSDTRKGYGSVEVGGAA
jgi:hypothetical protein